MSGTSQGGHIVTFYSYKGGVGRTMALANVAFLAAANGHRVLVMDWDLEAPGLHYYFRGLLEAPEARALKESVGILDIVWDWTRSLEEARTAAQTAAVFERFDDSSVFRNCVRQIPTTGRGRLDFINAGGPKILTSELQPYEEALAHFSWPRFFEDYAGGSILERLRNWAKSEYDYILVDSRTGLADVSGICTMQIPDAVALCFVLNRQNIDGVAKVAAAIRAQRQDEVTLHAVPMRVAASDTSEEADARARGIHELTKIGGFSEENVSEDFKVLAVRAAANVPYYETLAPIIATDAETDPLTFNYLRLAARLLGTNLELPEFEPGWIEMVRRRLQPRNATIEYVSKLTAADPVRAVNELQWLLESARETVLDEGDLSDEYVEALVQAALFLSARADYPYDAGEMLNRACDLLRELTVVSPEKWRNLFISVLDRHVEVSTLYLEPDEELSLLEELDILLSGQATAAARLRRIDNRRRVARLYIMQNDWEAANQTIGEMTKLTSELRLATPRTPADQQEQLIAAEIEAFLLRGEVLEQQDMWDKAFREYTNGLDKLQPYGLQARGDFSRLAFELNNRIARAPVKLASPEQSALRAVEAARVVSTMGGFGMVTQFADLADIVAKSPDLVLEFCEYALDTQERRGGLSYGNYYGRLPRLAAQFFNAITRLVPIIGPVQDPRVASVLLRFVDTAASVWKTLDRRRYTIGERQRALTTEPLEKLERALRDVGLAEQDLSVLTSLSRTPARKPRTAGEAT
ncbi:ParA family protein [Mesorhizobium sp. L2C067A000]|uniref:KGGVGR-motif variant AAA ATPase n=1 Tax=Mesorhizobium sp. L2C067A000 TaxID=1287106 RepID=UPI0003CF9E79|nr:ParA family protein [Mesorhizobium sp. L2C067A000]ESZ26590.1 hypothetical protein X733_29425 [Mesorhizobium sp. L2C067A000]